MALSQYTMAESTLKTLQHIIQDVIAPDVRELKVRVESLEKRMDERFDSMQRETQTQFQSMQSEIQSMQLENQAQYQSILAAIGESKSDTHLYIEQKVGPISERVALLEAQRN